MTDGVEHLGDAPSIDWEYLYSINPDIVGWITIPGTSIDHPIVQASPDDPLYYLSHDVYGNWNPWGAIYLSSECAALGLDSQNSVIYGHNMGGADQSQFGDLENYIDEDWARSHPTIFLQTSHWNKSLSVSAVTQTTGQDPTNRTDFIHVNDFLEWYAGRYSSSRIQLKGSEHTPEINYTFVTCSYNYWNDERTLIYAD